MQNNLIDDFIDSLQNIFPGREITLSAGENMITVKNAKGIWPLIDVDINKELKGVLERYNLQTGQVAWSFDGNDFYVQIFPNLAEVSIIEGHWSTDKSDSHSENDADSTYAVVGAKNEPLYIFNTRQEAEKFLVDHKNK